MVHLVCHLLPPDGAVPPAVVPAAPPGRAVLARVSPGSSVSVGRAAECASRTGSSRGCCAEPLAADCRSSRPPGGAAKSRTNSPSSPCLSSVL